MKMNQACSGEDLTESAPCTCARIRRWSGGGAEGRALQSRRLPSRKDARVGSDSVRLVGEGWGMLGDN